MHDGTSYDSILSSYTLMVLCLCVYISVPTKESFDFVNMSPFEASKGDNVVFCSGRIWTLENVYHVKRLGDQTNNCVWRAMNEIYRRTVLNAETSPKFCLNLETYSKHVISVMKLIFSSFRKAESHVVPCRFQADSHTAIMYVFTTWL